MAAKRASEKTTSPKVFGHARKPAKMFRAGRLKREYGWNDTWVAGYSNDVFAYIPSLRVLHEGGYEGGGAMIPYGQPAPFGAAVEEIIIEKVADLMRKTAD